MFASRTGRWAAGLLTAVCALTLLPALPAQSATASTATVSAADTELARKYAPKIIFDPAENYFPSDVESFLANTHTEQHGDETYRVPNQPLGCPSCTDPEFLGGTAPGSVQPPIYAQVVHRTANGRATNITDINYWQFFPYNRGKRVCVGLYSDIWGGCLGGYSTFGNHVGDWEHITVRLVDDAPYQVSLSQHDGGQTQAYGTGEIATENGRPVVYSARGSHALYPYPGHYTYRELFNGDSLTDIAGYNINSGIWDTRQSVKVFAWQPPGTYTGEWSWLNYDGRWGTRKDGCTPVLEDLTGQCILVEGPDGPNLKGVYDPSMQAFDGQPDLFGGGVAKAVADGNRVGIVTTDNDAYVREGGPSASWTRVSSGVKQLVLSGNRIGVLGLGGDAYVKEGGVDAAWTRVSQGVGSLALSGNRIGIVGLGGDAYVKEGALDAGWVHQYNSVSSLVLSGNRIGVLSGSGGLALVKEGGLYAEWTREYDNVSALALSGNRIGVISGGEAYVKEGDLHAGWVREYGDVTSLVLSGNRIGVISGGVALVKEGDLHAGWAREYDGPSSLVLAGNRIGVLSRDTLRVKEGGLGAIWAVQNFSYRG
ncbi:Vps62-related protein [Streptomyces geranii]|uniref:Vps62-related protein n=1 Tax=Streptomyces geranii TaxID=2058923 RepID=UPI000D034391|nr:Vps62-related protein [Streptomyces geranii]